MKQLVTGLILLGLLLSRALFAQDVLYVYNWSDYVAPDTLSRFEKETGIKVVYDVYDSNQILEAKLYAGNTGYDVVFPTNFPYFMRQREAGLFQPINPDAIPAIKDIDKPFLEPLYHDGKLYGVPYMWGTVGIGYNKAKIEKIFGANPPVDSWAFVFDPNNLKQMAGCKVAFMDSAVYLYPIILNYLGLDPKSTNYEDYKKATEVMRAIRPYITYFHDSQYMNDLANGNICVAVGWSGDIVMARDRAQSSGNKIQIEYRDPKEGSLFLYDVIAVPATSKNVEAAQQFMNYLENPKTMAKLTEHIGYPSPVSASKQYLPKDIADDVAIYPTDETMQHFFTPQILPLAVEKNINRDWVKMKAGK